MPYIKKELRGCYDVIIDNLPDIQTKGELEYCVFKLIKKYMSAREYKYSNLHNAVYAAIHASEEFKRRFLDSREDQAIIENGDIK
jgi:hypothetical protein